MGTWISKRAQSNGPISQNSECRRYRVHYFGHFGGPGTSWFSVDMIRYRFEPRQEGLPRGTGTLMGLPWGLPAYSSAA